MSTVQVDKHIKKRLFSYAAKLQEKSGRKVSLSEAIGKLLDSQQIEQTDRSKILSLYGILKDDGAQGRNLLKELRDSEGKSLERRRYSAGKSRA